MITEISRNLTGIYYAANTTIAFNQNPYLIANNQLTIFFQTNDSRVADTVVSTSGNTAIITYADNQFSNTAVTVQTNAFGSGITGAQPAFSMKTTTPPSVLFQAFSSNNGTANVKIQTSTDNAHWIDLATLTLNSTNAYTAYTTTTTPWPYARLNIIDISAGSSIACNKVI